MKILASIRSWNPNVHIAARAGLLCLVLVSCNAWAVNCQVTVTPLDFGIYNPGATGPLDVTGNLDLRCVGQPGSFVVTINQGSSGNFLVRELVSGPDRLQYNLYTDAARSLIWGDGNGGTSVNVGSKSDKGPPLNISFPIYARIFPRQNVGAGVYADALLVTAVF
jgi:spore coat protein U-like protein